MITNKDIRVEGSNLILNGEKHPLDPAIKALTKRANIVQGKFSALDTKLDAFEALEKTASGNPISLTGAAAAYAISNIMTIEPIQSGSGDPSPTNVRPISGISTASVQTTNGTDTKTASITLGQTVYGGSVNFKTGEVTVTHGMVDLGTLTWIYNTNGGFSSDTLTDIKTGLCDLVCSGLSFYSDSFIWGDIANIPNYSIAKNAGNKDLYVKDTDYTNAAAFKTAMSGVQLCYELATPTTLTLTPAELELLKGNNTVSGNGANINLSYIGR